MKRLFYLVVWVLTRVTIWGTFSRVEIRGLDRVPWDQPCVVSPNHQNAFVDALLVGAFVPVKLRFLSRAAVFGTAFDWFLEALHMVPIYRRRDGFDKLSRNKDILEQERKELQKGRSLVMFSETEHAHTYYLRPLSRGSSRFALKSQEHTDREVVLVPVGINYYHHRRPGFKVSIVFGDPIPVSEYMDEYRDDDASCINQLRDDLTEGMKACMVVPEETDDYLERVDHINRKNEHLPFPEMKRALQSPENLESKGEPRGWLETLAWGISPLNVGPVWLTNALMRWVDEPPFALSLKFAVGMFGFPLWWLGLFGIVSWATSWTIGAAVVALAVLTLGLRILLIRYSNPPHRLE